MKRIPYIDYYNNGKSAFEYAYTNGEEHIKEYYTNGILLYDGEYLNKQKNGKGKNMMHMVDFYLNENN